MAMSDYIAVMDKGRIVQFGEPRALYERPRSRFVAAFLGNINLFDGSAEILGSGRSRFNTADGLNLVIGHDANLPSKSICAVGFRPERLIVSPAPTHLANELPGKIEQISYGGTLSRTIIRLASGRLLDATLMNVRGSAGTPLAVGDTIHVGLPEDAAVVLSE